MISYVCPLCGHIHVIEIGDIEQGIAPGTPWEDIPDEYLCPSCYAPKMLFEPLDG